MDIIKDASQNIADRLTWHTAGRDHAGIVREFADGQNIPEVYGLGEAGLFSCQGIVDFLKVKNTFFMLLGFGTPQ